MQVGRSTYYTFDDFRIDVDKQTLLKNGKPVALSHKAFEVLLLLVSRQNQIVEKEFLLSEIWQNSFVEESNLTQYVHILRKTLGQDKKIKPYIETINKIGYRFSADVRAYDHDDIFVNEDRRDLNEKLGGNDLPAASQKPLDERLSLRNSINSWLSYVLVIFLLFGLAASWAFFSPQRNPPT